ncbi:hypothetical protein VTH82DRAFT_8122 [Thermothelomyces myriococcoides]
MAITHIVLVQFKADISPEVAKAVLEDARSLKDNCVHPTSKQPYILSVKIGKDNSPEGLQNGLTHGFVVEFASAEDRNYYVNTDPAHQNVARRLKEVAEKVIVLDFSDGAF